MAADASEGRVSSWWRRPLIKSTFVRSATVLMTGTVVGQAISILASPVLTRLYTPGDYGILAVLASVLSILLVIASLRYELAIPVPKQTSEAASLLVLSLVMLLAVSLLSVVVIVVAGERVAGGLGMPGVRPYLWYVPVALVTAGAYNALRNWAIRTKAFGRIARTRVSQGAGGVATQIGLGLVTTGPIGLIAGAVVGQALGVSSLAGVAWRDHKRIFRRLSVRRIASSAVTWRRFPLLSGPSAVLNTAGVQITPILLGTLYGSQIVGWFSLGQRVIGLPMAIIGQALAHVYFGQAAAIARESPAALNRLFTKITRRLVLLSAVIVPAIVAVAPRAFALVFGEQWREAGEFVRVLAPMFLAQLIVSPLSQTIFIVGRQDLQLAWDVGRLATVIAVFVISFVVGLDARTTITVYGATMFAVYVIAFLMYRYVMRKYLAGSEL